MKRLIRADLLLRYRTIVGVGLGAAAFLLLFSGTYETFGGAAAINQFMGTSESASFISAFTGSRETFFIAGPLEYLAFGFNHPFFLILTMSIGVGMGSAAVSGDVENGRAELLYTKAVRRVSIYDARVALWVAAQVVVVYLAVAGAYVGSAFSDDVRQSELGQLFLVATQYLPVALFAGALAFAVSAFRSTRGSAIGVTVAVLVAAYLANFTALLWDPGAALRWLSPFGYYEPIAAVHGIDWAFVAVLLGASALLVAVGRWRVAHRDLV